MCFASTKRHLMKKFESSGEMCRTLFESVLKAGSYAPHVAVGTRTGYKAQ